MKTLSLPYLAESLATTTRASPNVERLAWSQGIAFSFYGARIGIRSNDRAALVALVEVLPPHRRALKTLHVDWLYSLYKHPSVAKRPGYSLYSNGERLVRTPNLPLLSSFFEREVQLAVAQAARGKVFVHAGVVGWQGRAIVLPGRSFAGKSTLVRELVRAGAVYYSDEYAVLDTQGRVHPFARPLALRNDQLENQKISFAELGGVIGSKPLPVALIVASKYRAGAKWRPQALTPGLGALELLANTVTARTKQREVLETLAYVAAHATSIKGTRGEASELAQALLAALN